MVNLVCSCFAMVLFLSGCGWNDTPTRQNDFIPLTSIVITAVSPTIAAGTSTKLTATGNYSGQFTRDITDQVVWSSASPAVADFKYSTAPNRARVSGVTVGSAILTATLGSISSPGLTLTVSGATITGLTVTPASLTLAKGLTNPFTAAGTFSDSTTQDITFDVAWSSSDVTVATVSDDIASKGSAKAIAVGTATFTATFGSKSGTAAVTVTEPVLQSIAVSPQAPSVLSISTASFTAIGTYSDGTTPDITALVSWGSSDTSSATISAGVAKALAQGTTSISATLGRVSGSSNLRVTGGNLTKISVDPPSPKLVKGTVSRITATGIFSNGTSRDLTGAVEWSSSDSARATVTSSGGTLAWLNALETTSSATITAKSGLITGTSTLAVTAPTVTSVAISPTSMALNVGTKSRYILIATFSDSTAQDVTANSTWKSDSISRASVEDNDMATKGRVSGVSSGSATITATYGGKSVTAPVTVTARNIQTLNVSTLPTGFIAGTRVAFTATANYFDGTSMDVTENTTWTLDKQPYVAMFTDSLNQPGQVVAVDSGSATLTATFGSLTKTTTITVP